MPILTETPMDIDLELVSVAKNRWNSGGIRESRKTIGIKKPSITLSLFVFQNDDDLPYEEEILRNAYSVKHWMRYVEHKKNASKHVINQVYERAIKQLPGSYKLW
jgi:hypothetical protein